MGDTLTKIIIAEYLVLAIVELCCGRYAKAAYWGGAVVLTIGILCME